MKFEINNNILEELKKSDNDKEYNLCIYNLNTYTSVYGYYERKMSLIGLIRLLCENNFLEEAKSILDNVIKYNLVHKNYFMAEGIGKCAFIVGDYENAVKFYEAYLNDKHFSVDLFILEDLAMSYYHIGQYDKAMKFYESWKKYNKNYYAESQYYAGEMAVKIGDYKLAIEKYNNFIKDDSFFSKKEEAILKLANAYLTGTFSKDGKSDASIPISVSKAISTYKNLYKTDCAYRIGLIYYYGLGNEKVNYKKAVKYLLEGSYSYEMGECYYYGRGIEQSYSHAYKHYGEVAKQNRALLDDPVFCDKVVECQKYNNLASYIDEIYYEILIKRNDVTAYYYLAKEYEKKLKYSSRIEELTKKIIDAYSNYLKLVDYETHIKIPSFLIATYEYLDNNGVNVSKYRKLYVVCKALLNDKNYMYEAGCLYLNGTIVTKDINKAKEYFNNVYLDVEKSINEISKKDDFNKYITIYETINLSNPVSDFKYALAKKSLGEYKYVKTLGYMYLEGKGTTKDIKKAKELLNDYLLDLESTLSIENPSNAEKYIDLFDQLNQYTSKKTFKYFFAKALLGDENSINKVAEMYMEGNGIEKDIEKGRYFYNIILSKLEEKFDETNKKLLEEYILLYEKMYPKEERNSFKYYLAYACFENHYCEYVVGLHYEAGDGVEMDIEKAKEYFKKAYEGGCEIAYGKYHEYFEPDAKPKVSEVLVVRYIQLLELNEDTDITEEDVISSYKALSKIYHPDIANSRYKDGKKFNELKKARDYLLEYIEDVNSIRQAYFFES